MQTAATPKWVSSHRTVNSVVVVVVVVVVILVIVVIVVVVVVIVIIVVRTQCLRYGGCVSWSPPPLTNATARTHAQNHTQSNAWSLFLPWPIDSGTVPRGCLFAPCRGERFDAFF